MLRSLLLPLAVATGMAALAQTNDQAHRTCGAHTITKRHLEQQGLPSDLLNAMPRPAQAQRGGTFIIPIVVHVVWNIAAENVPTGTIQAIIDELNEDYSASNPDIGQVRPSFTNSVGNVAFQFCLAQVDPNGNPTTGITRTQTTDTWFNPDTQTDDMKSAPLGIAPWDTESYLNIWICDITSGATGGTVTVGYAYLPTGGVVGSDIDGLVIDYDYGTELGARTATHEIGHYFGLMHTFDDGGDCVNADGFTDTPTSDSPTFSCSNTNLVKCGVLNQYENFMDYSSCTVMFTDQQAAYMADVLNEVRGGLLLNDACSGIPTGYCIPTSVNGTADGDFIDGVELGSISNTNSGGITDPTYTDFSSSFSTSLSRGSSQTITITSGTYAPDNYAAWIDYDQDELFEASEKLGEFVTSAAGEDQDITFIVPASATLGNTILRVRGVYHNDGEPVPTDPCFAYDFGETEDYGITIANSGAGGCTPSSANGTSDGDFINAVVLEEIQNLNTGGIAGPSYTNYSASFSADLARNEIHAVTVQSGDFAPDNFAVWIDYDQDDTFEASEKLGEFATAAAAEAQTLFFTVPATAALGNTTMRVRGVYFDTGEPTPVDPCFNYAYGETEDYGITITLPGATYCIPTSLGGTSDGDYINGVELGSINNTNSGSITAPTYSNLELTDATELVRGTNQTLVIESGEYAPDHYAAWIDYDNDQIFESSEKLGEFTTAAAGETGSIPFLVPMSATLGTTRMRVRGVYHDTGEPTPSDPCFSYAFGETEDYSIIIETTTGLPDGSALVVGIHPNPTSGKITVNLPSQDPAHITVLDLQGRLLAEQQSTAKTVNLDLSPLASGTYLIRIQQGGSTTTQRIELISGGR